MDAKTARTYLRECAGISLDIVNICTDFDLTRLFGEANSSVRTPKQTEIGLFQTDQPFYQDARAWTYRTTRERQLFENNFQPVHHDHHEMQAQPGN